MKRIPFLEFKRGRYFAGVAFVYGDQDRDWLASMWRELPSGPWRFTHRIRLYVDEQAQKSADVRSHFESKLDNPQASETEVLAMLREAGEKLVAAGFNDRLDLVEMKSGDPAECMRRIASRPWCHVELAPDPVRRPS